MTAKCYSQGINQQKCVGKFRYLKYFSRGLYLHNTSDIFLATPTLDEISKKPDTLSLNDGLWTTLWSHFARAAAPDTR